MARHTSHPVQQIVNAVYGFTSILLKVLNDLKPDYLAVTFDLPKPTFRHKEYKEYKANWVKQADELYQQFPIVKEVVKVFEIPIYEKAGFEADDVERLRLALNSHIPSSAGIDIQEFIAVLALLLPGYKVSLIG